MEFRILGPVEAREHDAPIALGGPRQRALLALLLLHANRPLMTEQLIDALWGEQPPRSGATAVQNQVLRLRKALGADRVATHGGGYALRVETGELDLERFSTLVGRARGADPERRAELLGEALAECRGEALGGVGTAAFAAAEAARLEELRLAAIEDRVDADLELGRHAELVGELSTLAALAPLRERVRAQLILALYRSGRQAEALDVYREVRRMLIDDLGLEPGPALRELERGILRHDPELDAPQPRSPTTTTPTLRRSTRRVAVGAAAGIALALLGGLAAFALTRQSPGPEPAAAVTTPRETRASSTIGGAPAVAAEAGESTGDQPARTTRTAAARNKQAATAPPKPETPVTAARTTTRSPSAERPSAAATPRPAPAAQTPRRVAPTASTGQSSTATKTTATTTGRTTTASVTTTTTTEAPPPKPPDLVRISDDFGRDDRDGTVWHQIVSGTGVVIRPEGGRLVVSIGADAVAGGQWNVIDGHYGSQCSFLGDFDARIDFDLVEWPEGSGVTAGLWAFFAETAIVRESRNGSSDAYVSWVVPADGRTELPDRRGSFRIARVDGVVTTYFWRDGGWRTMVSGVNRGAAVLGPSAQATPDQFGRVAVTVAFDNFSVVAREVSCPPGSAPPGS